MVPAGEVGLLRESYQVMHELQPVQAEAASEHKTILQAWSYDVSDRCRSYDVSDKLPNSLVTLTKTESCRRGPEPYAISERQVPGSLMT